MPSLSKPGENLLFEAELAETVSSNLRAGLAGHWLGRVNGPSCACPVLTGGGIPHPAAASPVAIYSRYQMVPF
jgi:hypothetical protein